MSPLLRYRRRHGLTQYELAERLGCSLSYPGLVERGDRTVSAELAVEWERRTRGDLTRYELRPDIFGKAPAA